MSLKIYKMYRLIKKSSCLVYLLLNCWISVPAQSTYTQNCEQQQDQRSDCDRVISTAVTEFDSNLPESDFRFAHELTIIVSNALSTLNCMAVFNPLLSVKAGAVLGLKTIFTGNVVSYQHHSNSKANDETKITLLLKAINPVSKEIYYSRFFSAMSPEESNKKSRKTIYGEALPNGLSLCIQNIVDSFLCDIRSGKPSVFPADFRKNIDSDKNIPYYRNGVSLCVLPVVKQGEKWADFLKSDDNLRLSVNTISKTFEDYGFHVKDPLEMLNVNSSRALIKTQPLSNYFDLLIENAPTDIVILAQLSFDSIGGMQQAGLDLTAINKYTAERYASTGILKSTLRNWPSVHSAILEILKYNDALNVFASRIDETILNIGLNGKPIDLTIESVNVEDISFDTFYLPQDQAFFREFVIDWINKQNKDIRLNIIGLGDRLIRAEIRSTNHNPGNLKLEPEEWGIKLNTFLNDIFSRNNIAASLHLKIIGNLIYISIE